MIATNDLSLDSFDPDSFRPLQLLIEKVDMFFGKNKQQAEQILNSCEDPIVKFFKENEFYIALQSINENCSNVISFRKRFFYWLNGLKVLQYLNFSHGQYYSKIPIVQATNKLLIDDSTITKPLSVNELLDLLRKIQREESYNP